MACAVRNRFEAVSRLELVRLRRKTAALSAAQRAEVEALAMAVTAAISAHVEAALEAHRDDALHDIVGRLFSVSPASETPAKQPGQPSNGLSTQWK